MATVTVVAQRGSGVESDARVKLHGAQVRKVASIEALPDGHAAIHLATDPRQLQIIPSNVMVNIASANGIRLQVRGIDGVVAVIEPAALGRTNTVCAA